ncbi:archaeal ATPase, fused to C-terminal DUF234 domain protein [Lachnospiraceae bacterium TWA4]|nr:archaeal ATPase, fused to C-terminal DUF234 domain protein [Lachnospiraceae bacterium TWA4]
MFYCRENELSTMNKRYKKNHFEFIVIYGRRRVGKTALINEFCKDKPTIYFSALNSSSKENLEALSKSIYLYQNPSELNAPTFRNFEDALDTITNLAKKQQLIFVIDEYPYLAKSEKSFSSRLQHLIDHIWQNMNLYLILCGSSMSFMEHQVLGYESPLYGRCTAQLKIEALSYRDIMDFYPNLNCEDLSLIYGITSGIPHYINKLEVETTIDEALLENLFDTSSYLFEEPQNLLKQELREPSVYNSIITAIANGASHSNEISTKVGLESSICSKYLRSLLELGIIKKEIPVTEKSGKKTIYLIDDNFFRFWYRFVPKNLSIIQAGQFPRIYERAVKQHLSDYMGLVFEKMCQEFLLKYYTDLPILCTNFGQWWGTDPKTKKQIQIDIVGVPVEGNEYIIGSCKYKNSPIGVDEFELLSSYSKAFGKGSRYHYVIFSKGGFTNGLKELEEQGKVKLFTLEDLYLIH